MITDRNRGHALPDRLNHSPPFVPQDRREDAFRISARQGVGIGVTNARRNNPQQHFARFGHGNVNFYDFQRLFGLEGYGSTGLDHRSSPAK